MLTYAAGLEDLNLARVFIYIHILCIRAVKALTRLCVCIDSPESLLLDNAISIKLFVLVLAHIFYVQDIYYFDGEN